MNVTHEQFIGIYDGAFSKEYCESVINYFEKMSEAGFTQNRQQMESYAKSLKDDLALISTDAKVMNLDHGSSIQREFNTRLWNEIYPKYAEEFWPLKEFSPHNSYAYKIQKTDPGQGYHVWHCESGAKQVCHRILAWTLYLNDVEEGGETEFIFQHMRVKPKTGTFVIWPAGFTHTHRGNPPLSNTKYIVTGWIEF